MKRILLLTVLLCGMPAWSANAVALTYTVTDLGMLPGDTQSFAMGINNAGQVVGYSNWPPSVSHAFLYSGGPLTYLGTLGGGSEAFGVNDTGQAVGTSRPSSGLHNHAFLYSGGAMTDLGTLGGAYSKASAVNSAGQVAGESWTSAGITHAFLYSGGAMQDLGPGTATAINGSGQIVGEAGGHAFLYSGGAMTDLGTLFTVNHRSHAKGINGAGQVVGHSETWEANDHAFLYAGGVMRDLNDLIAPGTFNGTIVYATGINDSGQIAATAIIQGQYHAVLLSPESPANPVPVHPLVWLFAALVIGCAG